MDKVLQKYNSDLKMLSMAELLSKPDRFERFSCRLGGLLLDYSRVRIDDAAKAALLELANTRGVLKARDQLFAGEAVNLTEKRPALHMLLRGDCVDQAGRPKDAERALQSVNDMLKAAGALNEGRLPGGRGAVSDIIHIGIGGSLLGTQLIHEALGSRGGRARRILEMGS